MNHVQTQLQPPNDDGQVISAFFGVFRQTCNDLDAELTQFFKTFDEIYWLARSARASGTPHFDVLRVFHLEFDELRHSDALAWFLDPRAEHEQGPLFANALLRLCRTEPVPSESYTVVRERHERTDVAFYAPAQFAVFIENKVRHYERKEQVSDMVSSLAKLSGSLAVPRERRFGVFLTDGGAKPVSGPTADSEAFLVRNLLSLRRVEVFECFRTALEAQPAYSLLLMNFIDSYLGAIRRLPTLIR